MVLSIGWWVFFPIMGVFCMLLMMSGMFGMRRRGRAGMGPMCRGPMGMMGGHGDANQTTDDTALEMLRRRYAAGELSDEQFDAMRRKLEDRSG